MVFRDLVAEIDSVVFDTLADVGYIDGRRPYYPPHHGNPYWR